MIATRPGGKARLGRIRFRSRRIGGSADGAGNDGAGGGDGAGDAGGSSGTGGTSARAAPGVRSSAGCIHGPPGGIEPRQVGGEVERRSMLACRRRLVVQSQHGGVVLPDDVLEPVAKTPAAERGGPRSLLQQPRSLGQQGADLLVGLDPGRRQRRACAGSGTHLPARRRRHPRFAAMARPGTAGRRRRPRPVRRGSGARCAIPSAGAVRRRDPTAGRAAAPVRAAVGRSDREASGPCSPCSYDPTPSLIEHRRPAAVPPPAGPRTRPAHPARIWSI